MAGMGRIDSRRDRTWPHALRRVHVSTPRLGEMLRSVRWPIARRAYCAETLNGGGFRDVCEGRPRNRGDSGKRVLREVIEIPIRISGLTGSVL